MPKMASIIGILLAAMVGTTASAQDFKLSSTSIAEGTQLNSIVSQGVV